MRRSIVALIGTLALLASGTGASLTPAAAQNNCDVTVESGDSIQDAVNNASSGDIICVRPGTYAEDVDIDKDVTVRGQASGRKQGNPVIDGSVLLDAGGAELHNVVVTRTDDITPTSPDPVGILVKESDTVVADNVVRDFTGNSGGYTSINGIQVFGGDPPISNIEVRGNTVVDFRNVTGVSESDGVFGGLAGIKLQAGVEDVTVAGNTVSDFHADGWTWGIVLTPSGNAQGVPTDAVVTNNTMDRLNDGSEFPVFTTGGNEGRGGAPFPGSAFGVDSTGGGPASPPDTAKADEVTLKQNNLLAPNGAESKDESSTLDATCNWWGDPSGPFHANKNPDGRGTWALERGGADIDFDPWLHGHAPSRTCGVGGP